MDDRYRITPVTYTTTFYYFMYRFLSGLCRHHQVGVHHTLDAQAHNSPAGLHRAEVGRGEECACLQCRRCLMQVKTCSVGLARSLSPINEQMFLEEMVEQLNTVCRELRLASVADR